MLNHFRSLLLNTVPANVTEARDYHIAREYTLAPLTGDMLAVYNALFPTGSSIAEKSRLAFSYLRAIHSAGLSSATLLRDTRVTYDLASQDTSYYATRCIGAVKQVVGTAPDGCGIIPTSTLSSISPSVETVRLLVTQNSNTTSVTCVSLDSEDSVIKTYFLNTALVFDGNDYSQELEIFELGLKFKFYWTGGSSTFVNTSSKEWEFYISGSKDNGLLTTLASLEKISTGIGNTFNLPSTIDNQSYDKLWLYHKNGVYRLAGLLIGFTYRVDKLRS